MPKRIEIAKIVVITVMASLSRGPEISWACTKSLLPPKETPSSFTVVGRDRDRPLPGMKVFVDGVKHVQPVLTDANGYAHFERLREGSYNVHLEVENGTDESIHVNPSISDPKYAIWLRWPSLKVLTANKAAGVIRGGCKSAEADCPLSTNLTLIEGGTSRKVSAEAIRGNFDFGEVPNGTYFLRLHPLFEDKYGWEPDGDIAIEVDHGAVEQALEIDVGMSSCGLDYTGSCRVEMVVAQGLCGDY